MEPAVEQGPVEPAVEQGPVEPAVEQGPQQRILAFSNAGILKLFWICKYPKIIAIRKFCPKFIGPTVQFLCTLTASPFLNNHKPKFTYLFDTTSPPPPQCVDCEHSTPVVSSSSKFQSL